MDAHHKDHKQVRCWMIERHNMSKIEDHNMIFKPLNIQNDIRREFVIDINYYKEWMHRKCALKHSKSSLDLSYDRWVKYCNILENNYFSTMTTFIEVDNRIISNTFLLPKDQAYVIFTHQ